MIYYFCKRWVGVDVNLQTFVPEGGVGVTKIKQIQTRGERGPSFGHFVISPSMKNRV